MNTRSVTQVNPNHARVAIGVFAALAALVIPAIASASSYSSTLTLAVSESGTARYYDGRDITISMNARYSAYNKLNSTFKVTLQRQGTFGYSDVGWTNIPRDGASSTKWTNVGPGTYRFYFSKANDGVTITSSNVKMFN
jgi:hypothetical protein